MKKVGLFQERDVVSNRTIYTASEFARQTLLHLQEVGDLQAVRPHTSRRKGLASYLFFVVTKGEGTLVYGGETYRLVAGSCVFIDCRNTYSHTSSSQLPWTIQWVHFDGSMMPGIYAKYLDRGGNPVFSPKVVPAFINLISRLHATADSSDYIRDMRINECLAQLLTLIMAESWAQGSAELSHENVQLPQQVKAFLDEHYAEQIALDQLAASFYVNKYTMLRAFKAVYGTTILSYLTQQRITQAKQLLRFTDISCEDVGRQVGIDEPGYFNRVFKKVEGVPPGEYRMRWQRSVSSDI